MKFGELEKFVGILFRQWRGYVPSADDEDFVRQMYSKYPRQCSLLRTEVNGGLR